MGPNVGGHVLLTGSTHVSRLPEETFKLNRPCKIQNCDRNTFPDLIA